MLCVEQIGVYQSCFTHSEEKYLSVNKKEDGREAAEKFILFNKILLHQSSSMYVF